MKTGNQRKLTKDLSKYLTHKNKFQFRVLKKEEISNPKSERGAVYLPVTGPGALGAFKRKINSASIRSQLEATGSA